MRKLYSENQIRKLAGESSKKLYRHRITVNYTTGASYPCDFNLDVIDANPTAYTATTFPQTANAIGRLPVTGVCYGNAGTTAIITTADSSAVKIDFTGYQYYDSDWQRWKGSYTWAEIASKGQFSDVVVEL